MGLGEHQDLVVDEVRVKVRVTIRVKVRVKARVEEEALGEHQCNVSCSVVFERRSLGCGVRRSSGLLVLVVCK